MNTGHQNKYDSVLKIQFRNNVGMGKGGTTLKSYLPLYKFKRELKHRYTQGGGQLKQATDRFRGKISEETI